MKVNVQLLYISSSTLILLRTLVTGTLVASQNSFAGTGVATSFQKSFARVAKTQDCGYGGLNHTTIQTEGILGR